jgi:Ino eighty subunit 1
MEFLDLFLPNDTSCASRARAFLWLCYHYHEGPAAEPDDDYDGDMAGLNPFSDPGSPGKAPRLIVLTSEEAALENLDSEEEKALAKKLVMQREAIVQDHLLKESVKESKVNASTPGETPSPAKPRGKRAAKAGPSAPLKRKAQVVKEEEPDEKKFKLDNEGFTSALTECTRFTLPSFSHRNFNLLAA